MSLDGQENGAGRPDPGGQTPVAHRRPLQPRSLNIVAPSPIKRRKQSHSELGLVGASPLRCAELEEPVTPGGKPSPCREEGRALLLGSADRQRGGRSLLLEVLSRLGVRDLVEQAAPACRLWRDVAHSGELWAVKRPHLRLVDQLLICEKLVERRSKGRLFKCKLLGTGKFALLRIVDLELTNAGKDDGVPTSFLREAALLGSLRHPNLVAHTGAEVLGKRAAMCTEFVFENFTSWFKRLDSKANLDRLLDIRGKFHQVLTGLSHIHNRGIMHRNLKPDNIFIDEHGLVKLGDFTTSRMLDLPVQAYTPEDPKERDRSGREMRRLWYRAPELVLRDEIYGPKVDLWSVGCLLAEAATSKALFQSDSEIDHLFRIFRLLGTPSITSWPEVVAMKNFSPKFPMYSRISFAQVTRAACCGSAADGAGLRKQAQRERCEILQHVLGVAAVLGPDGMFALDNLITIQPSFRAGADSLLNSVFLSSASSQPGPVLDPRTKIWLHADPCSPPDVGLFDSSIQCQKHRADESQESGAKDSLAEDGGGAGSEKSNGKTADTGGYVSVKEPSNWRSALESQRGSCLAEALPPASIPPSMMSSDMAWEILGVMQQRERLPTRSGAVARALDFDLEGAGVLPRLPRGFDSGQRAALVDFVIGLASMLSVSDITLHLAVSVADRYLALLEAPLGPLVGMHVLGATCLKIADTFSEQSKEYYKQESLAEYADATNGQAPSDKMLICEKELLPHINFDLHRPTVHWFAQCYLAYGRFTPAGDVANTVSFIADLVLLDYDLLAYPASLRAQCALLLAVFLLQRAPALRRRPSEAPVSQGGAAAAGACERQQQQSMAAAVPRTGGDCSVADAGSLPYLEHWDLRVRNCACQANTAIDAAMCLQAVVRALVVMRREWKGMKLASVENKHARLGRTLVYPDAFPVSRLVRYIIPDRQRGLIPE